MASNQANTEFSTLSGCIKALARMENKPKELADLCKLLGISAGNVSKKCSEVCERIRKNTPYYIVVDGVCQPAEKVTHAKTTQKEKWVEIRQIEKWTFKKVLMASRVYSESATRIKLEK